jgi:hypothetical protein
MGLTDRCNAFMFEVDAVVDPPVIRSPIRIYFLPGAFRGFSKSVLRYSRQGVQ